MALDRVERLTNLVALLLTTPRPLTTQEIADRVPGYPANPESCRRQFERDKELLRRESVPITVEHSETDYVYRIRPEDYYLPELELTDEERVALNVAVAAVRLEGGQGRDALLKLGGLERSADVAPLADLPTLPALPDLFDAYRRKAPATFRYHGRERTVRPYALLARRGHWYVAGHDELRDDVRTFRVDRIEGDVAVGQSGAFAAPEGFDAKALLDREPWELPGDEPVEVHVLVDAVAAAGVVGELGDEAVEERRGDGSIVVRLTVTNQPALRSWVLGLLDHGEVLSPPQVRHEIAGWLRAMAEGGR